MNKITKIVVPLLVLALTLVPTTASAWWYGAQMVPNGPHDAAEMPAGSLQNWDTVNSGQSIGFWVGDTNTLGFAQNGFTINKTPNTLCQANGWPNVKPTGTQRTCQPPNSWAMFWTFCIDCNPADNAYYGNVVIPPSGWQPTDMFYFSVATYTSKGEYSFTFVDSTRSQSVTQAACGTTLQGRFSGKVGGITESGSPTNVYGSAYVGLAALWAEDASTGQRNSGNTYAKVDPGVPQEAHITVVASNVFDFGFQSSGLHHTDQDLLWSGGFIAGNENFPPDLC